MSDDFEKDFIPTATSFRSQEHKRKTNQDFIDEQLENLKSKR